MIERRQTVGTAGAAWLGAVHLVVDAACVTAVLRASPPADMIGEAALLFVLGYDVLAFAGQLPFGWVLDRLRVRREATAAGLVLTIAAVALGPRGGLTTVLAAGLGNALFHVGAGAMVLAGSAGKATPSGVFVAPGALGLGLGLHLGRKALGVPTWPLMIAALLSMVVIWTVRDRRAPAVSPSAAPPTAGQSARPLAVVALLFLSVAVRSFVGAVGCEQCPKVAWMALLLPLAGFGGKALGGILADRFGWVDVGVAALLASAPLLAFSGGDPLVAVPGSFIFQMTMPVTLAAVYRVMPGRPALAFGLLCLALVCGVLPAYLPDGWHPRGAAVLALVLGSAAALYVALRSIEPLPQVSGARVHGTNKVSDNASRAA